MADFLFMNPYWLLGILPAIALSFWIKKGSSSKGLIASHLAQAMGISQNRARYIHHFWFVFWSISCIALAGPSFEKQTRPAFNVSHARVLVLDMSRSLYANDIKPNRLQQLKYKALDLLPEWKEGSTGLVVFAGGAYTISPLTTDSQTLASLIPDLKPEIMPHQGSNVVAAVELAIKLMSDAGHQKGDIILLADELTEAQAKSVTKLLGNSWRMSAVAIGTEQGAPILLPEGELLKSPSGNTVIAKTEFDGFNLVARHSGGVFSPLRGDGKDVEAISALSITPSTSSDSDSQEISDRINNGYWLLPALVIAALGLFRKGFVFAIVLFVFPMPKPALASPFQTDDQAGFQAYQSQDFEKAAKLFESKEWAGAAWYEAKQYDKAIESLEGIQTEGAQYNLANALAQKGELEKARDLYESILEKKPNFEDAKRNLSIVEEALKQQQQQQQQQQQDSQSDSNQEQQDEQNASSQEDSADSQNSQDQQSQQQQNGEQSQSQQSKGSSENSDDASQTGEQNAPQDNKESDDSNDSDQKPDSDRKQGAEREEGSEGKQDSENEDESESSPQPASSERKSDDDSEEDTSNQIATGSQTQGSTQEVDPQIRQLEQIQQQADASRLLRAQMILQERQNPASQRSEQSW
ncbi:VWA domain-containing protein [Vibrio penaeicida]|uniref:VWA domain-containing protein n=1 Tax=Vibrio penaeicida TaxID=104609 RepID=UPI001CC3DF69|nr:VWA domain-containing protein [Vibrio penaeicida]